MVALKSTYRRLFHKIIVRPRNEASAELEFVLKQTTSPSDNSEVKFCTAVGLVGTREVESLTSAMSTLRSNQLSYAPALRHRVSIKNEGVNQLATCVVLR